MIYLRWKDHLNQVLNGSRIEIGNCKKETNKSKCKILYRLNHFKKLKIIVSGHYNLVLCLAALPNGSLASGSDDTTIRIWNVTTGSIFN